MKLVDIAKTMGEALEPLSFSEPVTHVYNPITYAAEPHFRYLRKYGKKSCEVLLVGMNPGPWGMAQTGVPFGEVEFARRFLKITGKVNRPSVEHPKRPIQGFDCPRSEVSGSRLWGFVEKTFSDPEAFARRFFISNYCPLVFMEETGRNRTPDKLPASERVPLFEICDRALRETAEWLKPELVIGVGVFAEKRAKESLQGLDVAFGRILHPSPASPLANRGWAQEAKKQLRALGVKLP